MEERKFNIGDQVHLKTDTKTLMTVVEEEKEGSVTCMWQQEVTGKWQRKKFPVTDLEPYQKKPDAQRF
jgi:uncharacterized protein YodC (DUF2158 family)